MTLIIKLAVLDSQDSWMFRTIKILFSLTHLLITCNLMFAAVHICISCPKRNLIRCDEWWIWRYSVWWMAVKNPFDCLTKFRVLPSVDDWIHAWIGHCHWKCCFVANTSITGTYPRQYCACHNHVWQPADRETAQY